LAAKTGQSSDALHSFKTVVGPVLDDDPSHDGGLLQSGLKEVALDGFAIAQPSVAKSSFNRLTGAAGLHPRALN